MEKGWIDLPDDLMRLFWVGFKFAERDLQTRAKRRWARHLLGAQPRFLPFGLVMGSDGQVVRVHDSTWPSRASLDEISEYVQSGIKKAFRGGAKAGLMGVDASAWLEDPPRDAILLVGQTARGERLQMTIPYTFRRGRFTFDAPGLSPFTPGAATGSD